MYHVPEDIQMMLDDCFSSFGMRFPTNRLVELGNWNRHGLCHIHNPVRLAMEVILKAADPNLGDGPYLPPLKAFMDDSRLI